MSRVHFIALVGFALLSLSAATVFANAQVPQTVQYQGRLTDSAGNPITASTANLTFHIFGGPNVGAPELCPPFIANNVALVNGLFNVSLSFQWLGDPITNALKAGTTLWLQTDYNNTPIGTRQQISAALAAFRAQQADTAAYAKGFALVPASADSSVLQTNSVTSLKILDGSVNSSDLANGAVTGAKVAVATLTAAQMVPASLDSSVLQANSVTSLKILDASVNSSDIAAGAVTTVHIAPGAVRGGIGGSIAAGSVEGTEIKGATITHDKIADLPGIVVSSNSPYVGQAVAGQAPNQWYHIDQVALRAPAAGFVEVTYDAALSEVNANQFEFGITSDLNPPAATYVITVGSAAYRVTPIVSCRRIFPVTAGTTYTFYIWVEPGTGIGNAWSNAWLVAHYYPQNSY